MTNQFSSSHERSPSSGFMMIEAVSLTLVAALVVAVTLETYLYARVIIQRETARWQVHHRLTMATALMEKEIRLAGYRGGWNPYRENIYPAIQGGQGTVLCNATPCLFSNGDNFLLSGNQSFDKRNNLPRFTAADVSETSEVKRDALIIRYWRQRHEAYAYHLPPVVDQQEEELTSRRSASRSIMSSRGQSRPNEAAHFNYVTGFYIAKSSTARYGLYQRTGGQRFGQEVVPGINGLKCFYLERSLNQGTLSAAFVDAMAIQDWHRVVAVQCVLSAESDSYSPRYGNDSKVTAIRRFSVSIRNIALEQQGQQRYQQWIAESQHE